MQLSSKHHTENCIAGESCRKLFANQCADRHSSQYCSNWKTRQKIIYNESVTSFQKGKTCYSKQTIFKNFESFLNMKESRLSCKDLIFSVFNNNRTKTKYFTKNLHSALKVTEKNSYDIFSHLNSVCNRVGWLSYGVIIAKLQIKLWYWKEF